MNKISEQQAITEWVKFHAKFQELGLDKFYDVEKLREEITSSPCTTNDVSGCAYAGALLIHINMLMAIAQRMSKMVSGTFQIDDNSLMKICILMHLSKRFMFEESTNDWDIKRGYPFKFKETGVVLKTGERSVLEAMNNGVKFTEEEYEAIKAVDEDDVSKHVFQSPLAMIVRQANELAYAIERERYKKITKSKEAQ